MSTYGAERNGDPGDNVPPQSAESEEHGGPPSAPSGPGALEKVRDEEWYEAQERRRIIAPLVAKRGAGHARGPSIRAVARAARRSPATILAWLRRHGEDQRLTGLVPRKRGWPKGASRLSPEVEAIIETQVEKHHLTPQKKRVSKTLKAVNRALKKAGREVARSTLIRRIKLIDARRQAKAREGADAARAMEATPGTFPYAEWPLSVAEADHWKLDMIVVDEETREPLGRPWLTLIVDVFSRMVLGFYIALEPPSATSVAMAVAHAVCRKEKWLEELEVPGTWPCWGIFDRLLVDNAKEFRSKTLQRGCDEYGIIIEWRPIHKPQWAPHVERLFGTFAQTIHALPGTTFSNPLEKGDYDSSKRAAFTLRELERWLTIEIVCSYHVRLHRGIGTTPMAKWQSGIRGEEGLIPRGLPPEIGDEARLRLDFMPYELRTVQKTGIQLFSVEFWAPLLRRFLGKTDPNDARRPRKYLVRWDPRRISPVYFLNPQDDEYYPIPFRHVDRKPLSLWELRAAQKRLREAGAAAVDEEQVHAAAERQEQIEETAKKKTQRQRWHSHQRKNRPKPLLPEAISKVDDLDADAESVLPYADRKVHHGN